MPKVNIIVLDFKSKDRNYCIEKLTELINKSINEKVNHTIISLQIALLNYYKMIKTGVKIYEGAIYHKIVKTHIKYFWVENKDIIYLKPLNNDKLYEAISNKNYEFYKANDVGNLKLLEEEEITDYTSIMINSYINNYDISQIFDDL